jgi:hypothetical protein
MKSGLHFYISRRLPCLGKIDTKRLSCPRMTGAVRSPAHFLSSWGYSRYVSPKKKKENASNNQSRYVCFPMTTREKEMKIDNTHDF